MHYVRESATLDRWAIHRRETSRRINACALRLTEAQGLDGFSMDELADAAGVSRRTLFNYFPGKDAAVLGDPLALDPALTDRFVAGGPDGHLVDDLIALVEPVLSNEEINPDDVARFRRVLAAEPRLVAQAHQRFETVGAEVLELIAAREGDAHDATRARAVIHVLAALFDLAITEFVEDPQREFPELFHDVVTKARTAFA